MDLYTRAVTSIDSWTWKPLPPDASPARHRIQAAMRFLAVVIREFVRDEIPTRASTLAFTVVLSLIPALAFTTAIMKGFVDETRIKSMTYQYIERMGETEPDIAATDGDGATQLTPAAHMKRVADLVFDYVDRTNFATLGAAGILGFIATFFTLMSSLENALNAIWRAGSERPVGKRIVNYFLFLFLIPLSANVFISALGTIEESRILGWIGNHIPISASSLLIFGIFNFFMVVAFFALLYRILPHRHVPLRAALSGGLVGGCGWMLTYYCYIGLQMGLARYNAIFGSFATLPLFLLWVYAGWVTFLVGAETAYAIQVWRRYIPEAENVPPAARLALAYDLLHGIYADFAGRSPGSLQMLTERIHADEAVMAGLLDALERKELVRCLDRRTMEYAPVTDADRIAAGEVAAAIFGDATTETAGGRAARLVVRETLKGVEGVSLGGILRGEKNQTGG